MISERAAEWTGWRIERILSVQTVADDEQGKDDSANLLQRIAQLEKQLKQVTKGNRNAQGSSSRKASSSKQTGARNAAGRGESVSADEDAPRVSPDTHPCHICNKVGHWHKDCPKRKSKSKEEAKVQPILAVSANLSRTKIYVTAKVNGEPVRCLLDSSGERSVIAAELAPNAKLTPSQYSLFAANKASLDFLVTQ